MKWVKDLHSPSIYLLKVNNGNTRTISEICSRLTKKKDETDVNNVALMYLLFTLNRLDHIIEALLNGMKMFWN